MKPIKLLITPLGLQIKTDGVSGVDNMQTNKTSPVYRVERTTLMRFD